MLVNSIVPCLIEFPTFYASIQKLHRLSTFDQKDDTECPDTHIKVTSLLFEMDSREEIL